MKWADSISNWIDTAWTDAQSRSIAESPAFKSRPGMSYADLSKSVIRYRIAGEGPLTLVLAVDALTCPRTFVQRRLESLALIRPRARMEQQAIGGAGRGCA